MVIIAFCIVGSRLGAKPTPTAPLAFLLPGGNSVNSATWVLLEIVESLSFANLFQQGNLQKQKQVAITLLNLGNIEQ